MRLILLRAVRSIGRVAAVLLTGGCLAGAVGGGAQGGGLGAAADRLGTSGPPPFLAVAKLQRPAGRIDPALRDEAARKAGDLVLASANGERQCPLSLKADPAGAGFALTFDKPVCGATIPFLVEVEAWLPDPSGELRLINAQGHTVVAFTEAAGGSYEALKEGDGVYFLSDPSIHAGGEVSAEDLAGDWDLSTGAGEPLCRWTLTAAPAPTGGKAGGAPAVTVAPGCAPELARLAPVSWRLQGGDILVSTRAGRTIRFARQEEGGWARVPEGAHPLLMSRP